NYRRTKPPGILHPTPEERVKLAVDDVFKRVDRIGPGDGRVAQEHQANVRDASIGADPGSRLVGKVLIFIPVIPKVDPGHRLTHGALVGLDILESHVPAHAILAAGENSMVVIPG